MMFSGSCVYLYKIPGWAQTIVGLLNMTGCSRPRWTINNHVQLLLNSLLIIINKDAYMSPQLVTYIAVDQNGRTVHVSAYTESDARQKAEDLLGFGNVVKFHPA